MHFFLGTNGPHGFFAYLGELVDYSTARQVNIIKGMPGSGKSTFIKNTAAALEETYGHAEYFFCASDPDSLDGVVFPDGGIVFVDGTAPHVMEPQCPGAVDIYLNFALLNDQPALAARRGTLSQLLAANKMCFSLATPLINAASILEDTAYKRVISPELAEKIKSRGRSLSIREIPKTKRAAVTPVKRFLSAMTPGGLACRFETVTDNFERVIALDDNFGLAGLMLPELAAYAASQGYKTYECYHPLHPGSLVEHVLIPELKLAFVTNSRSLPYPAKPTRHIRLDSCIPIVKEQRSGLRFIAKTRAACLEEAAGHLRDAKLVHYEVEALIKQYIDFAAIDDLTERKIRELLPA